MLAAGFHVLPTDGSPELAGEAEKRLRRPVRVLLFEDIDFTDEFDGVWANACLLHVPRPTLGQILALVRTALRQRGVFYASFKTGGQEGRDSFGRYYNHPDKPILREALGTGWSSVDIEQRPGNGYYNLPAEWLHVTAVKARS